MLGWKYSEQGRIEMSENNGKGISEVKTQIVSALSHPEADEGLFFRNFNHLHEVDQRPVVSASQPVIARALQQLICEGRVGLTSEGADVVFVLEE